MARRINGEGSIFRRKDGRWCGSYYDSAYKRHYVYGKTQKEVRQKLNDKKLGEALNAHREYLLKDWIKEYLYNFKRNEIKETTYGYYLMVYRKHIENDDIGGVLLTKLRSSDLQKFYNSKLTAGYNAKSVYHMSAILNCALQHAEREKMIPENPNRYTVLPKRKQYQTEILRPEEVKVLVNNAKEEKIYPLLITALFTGMRKGEIMGLRWSSIDFENEMIHVTQSLCRVAREGETPSEKLNYSYELMDPKSAKSIRSIPMLQVVKDVLLFQKERQKQERELYNAAYLDRDLVFARPDGTFLDQRAFMDEFHRVLRKYGVTDCRFHDLRHCFASLLLTSGTGMKVTSELLGHSTISTSMNIYAHVYDEMKTDALSKLNHLLEE